VIHRHIAFVIFIMPVVSKAQHKTEHTNVLWAAYNNTIRFNKKWSVISDVQLRTTDWTEKWLLYAVRTGVNYSFNEHISIDAGFTLFKTAQYGTQLLLFKNEWRPWEDISYQLELNKINLIQRLRTEQRFLQQVVNNKKSSTYQYIFRLRYRFEWQFPLEENKFKLLIGNEVLINPGYVDSTLFFDQNRTFAGINFNMGSNTNLQCQYIKIFQWHSNSSLLEDQNAFRVTFYQQFNLLKKHGSK
jgi:hypothetical protein